MTRTAAALSWPGSSLRIFGATRKSTEPVTEQTRFTQRKYGR